jgi:aminoglycoside phosphotransferase (APT) family kinase protein
VVAPALAARTTVIRERPTTSNSDFWQGTALIDDSHVVKFAWSEVPARRLLHEARMLRALHGVAPHLAVPEVAVFSEHPALLVTAKVPGIQTSFKGARGCDRLTIGLGQFLSALHDRGLLEAVRAQVACPTWEPQADTDSIRTRLPRFLNDRQARQAFALCEFADQALAGPSEEVLLHGDLHGDNLVVDARTLELRLVADFESSGAGDPAFDFRYMPVVGGSLGFLAEVLGAYEVASGRTVDVNRVMAWHIRTSLGDALWRSEAGVPLPFEGTPGTWVEGLTAGLQALGGTTGSPPS